MCWEDRGKVMAFISLKTSTHKNERTEQNLKNNRISAPPAEMETLVTVYQGCQKLGFQGAIGPPT